MRISTLSDQSSPVVHILLNVHSPLITGKSRSIYQRDTIGTISIISINKT